MGVGQHRTNLARLQSGEARDGFILQFYDVICANTNYQSVDGGEVSYSLTCHSIHQQTSVVEARLCQRHVRLQDLSGFLYVFIDIFGFQHWVDSRRQKILTSVAFKSKLKSS